MAAAILVATANRDGFVSGLRSYQSRRVVFDNFFDLGGHSLLSVKVIAILEKKLGLRLNPRELMFKTMGQLAAAYEERMPFVQRLNSRSLTQKLLNSIKSVISR